MRVENFYADKLGGSIPYDSLVHKHFLSHKIIYHRNNDGNYHFVLLHVNADARYDGLTAGKDDSPQDFPAQLPHLGAAMQQGAG